MTKAARFAAALGLAVGLACGGDSNKIPEISPQQVLAFAGRADAPLVLDVRSPEEFAGGHVPGAVNLPHDQVRAHLAELSPQREVVVYCELGGRAAKAAEVLHAAGFEVEHLTGDMKQWRQQGLPTEP